jgi:hypothetical protein
MVELLTIVLILRVNYMIIDAIDVDRGQIHSSNQRYHSVNNVSTNTILNYEEN